MRSFGNACLICGHSATSAAANRSREFAILADETTCHGYHLGQLKTRDPQSAHLERDLHQGNGEAPFR